MNTPKPKLFRGRRHAMKQRGIVLFFTLIAMVVMSLAAVALIRSVDTSTMIAGNLAFKQAGTSSGDTGIEAAIAWMSATEKTMEANGLTVLANSNHAFNSDNPAAGYYSNAAQDCSNPALPCSEPVLTKRLNITAADTTNGTRIKWDSTDSMLVTNADLSGNQVRYIIQRLCRTANTLPRTFEQTTATPPKTGCLFSSAALNNNGQGILNAPDICPDKNGGCPTSGQTNLFRITAKVTGPKNTVSYIQTVVY